MLSFLTSLSSLYVFTIAVVLLFGFLYYKTFVRSGYHHKRFPIVFVLVTVACFTFLWVNIHAPLKLRTFSNLDHSFIRHNGFIVTKGIELGKTDTANHPGTPFNKFFFSKKGNEVFVSSSYAEQPFYAGAGGKFNLLSVNYPASGHRISFQIDKIQANIQNRDSITELRIGTDMFIARRTIRKGSSLWNIFKDENDFINSSYYTNESISDCLKNILVLKDDISGSGELKYFLSARLFETSTGIQYDDKPVRLSDQQFNRPLTNNTTIGWGTGLSDNNRNRFSVLYMAGDSFSLVNAYPVSYPLTEENNNDWTDHAVNKFLVSDAKDILSAPPVFREGFLFSGPDKDSSIDFLPVLLTYRKEAGYKPVQLNIQGLNKPGIVTKAGNEQLILPAKSAGFAWSFSVRNTFYWEFGKKTLTPTQWQLFLFGTLAFFFIMVLITSLIRPAEKLSWVWQLLSCVTMVLLTTRFFLYWRYKSFPPYEGLDAPSRQQLESFWNFGIIILAGITLAVVFGFGLMKYLLKFLKPSKGLLVKNAWSFKDKPLEGSQKLQSKLFFFTTWLVILAACSGFASLKHFDPGTCRHLAIGLILVYFIYSFFSYKHSPLVASAETSWWKLSTGKLQDVLVSNPVKVFLSVSLLAVFAFMDIGFAIVFINFLLFNEAFLCINYAIAGLSAGSRRNANIFGIVGSIYMLAFALNLLYAPYILKTLLGLPQTLYLAGYFVFALVMAYNMVRLQVSASARKKMVTGVSAVIFLFGIAFFFFPKEKILKKAEMTRYRIDVMTMPVDEAIGLAYEQGDTYEPVIRAAQNQWFINTFIYEKNNPGVNSPAFHLLPHAPQNKGAKYNAQATDLVASRFFIAEHGKWSVLFFVFLLLLPAILLASFYKLYPDFTNRINTNYPTITAGFSVLNYLLITSLLVILAATGRYIFFGQDLPFGSILSKQSILFPSLLIIGTVLLFKNIPLEQYANRKKFIPGMLVFSGLALLLFFVKPVFNKNKEFAVTDLAKNMDSYMQVRLQPLLDHIDTSRATAKLSLARKDQLFTDSVRKLLAAGYFNDGNEFFRNQIMAYTRLGFTAHLDQRHMLYLDLYSGRPQLGVNDNFFRILPPPHLQQSWTGNVFGDSTVYNVSLWDAKEGSVFNERLTGYTDEPVIPLTATLSLCFRLLAGEEVYDQLYLVNRGSGSLEVKCTNRDRLLAGNDSILLTNPSCVHLVHPVTQQEQVLMIEPDGFMKNYYVNGSRFYAYPMSDRFIWARNFAESISSEYTTTGQTKRNAFVSLDFGLMDSLSTRIAKVLGKDTAYKKGAEYAVCIADGNGRLIAMTDFIKGMDRPDPNDKAGFNSMISGENGIVSQSLLRKQIGNINLLRLNPGPGSTLKPIVFSAIASQLNFDWSSFEADGFSVQQQYFGGEKVAKYDFEKNNGHIGKITDYLRLSDNYYHSNVLLLGSYPKQASGNILSKYFITSRTDSGFHWPYFNYKGKRYWLDGFENWPGYKNGKADFGTDSSFVSIGLMNNYGIFTKAGNQGAERFSSTYDSLLFGEAYRRSGFILPEYSLFDQQAAASDHRIPYDLFTMSFRGHVKGSSQVMIPPVKMLDAFGKLITQNRNYSLTLNPYAETRSFTPFYIDSSIQYNTYLSLMRDDVFTGMREALFKGTAGRLGTFLKDGSPWYYYAKTGTTGDDEAKSKSKLFTIIISSHDITDPDFNFRNNKFYTIYFTSQNGPVKQNEELQAEIIKFIQGSSIFNRYMKAKHQ